jgi:hypothetical protein
MDQTVKYAWFSQSDLRAVLNPLDDIYVDSTTVIYRDVSYQKVFYRCLFKHPSIEGTYECGYWITSQYHPTNRRYHITEEFLFDESKGENVYKCYRVDDEDQ